MTLGTVLSPRKCDALPSGEPVKANVTPVTYLDCSSSSLQTSYVVGPSAQISYRFQRAPARGDIVIFYPPEEVSKKLGFPPGAHGKLLSHWRPLLPVHSRAFLSEARGPLILLCHSYVCAR